MIQPSTFPQHPLQRMYSVIHLEDTQSSVCLVILVLGRERQPLIHSEFKDNLIHMRPSQQGGEASTWLLHSGVHTYRRRGRGKEEEGEKKRKGEGRGRGEEGRRKNKEDDDHHSLQGPEK